MRTSDTAGLDLDALGVPGLAVLLDDDALASLVRTGPGDPVRVTRRRLRLKPGTSAVLAAEVSHPGEAVPRDVLVSAYSAHAVPKLRKTLDRASAPGDLLAVDLARGLAVSSARLDRDLPLLARLDDSEVLERLTSAVTVGIRTLSYNPHRRWVGLVETTTGPFVVRGYRPRRAGAVWRTLEALYRAGAPVPQTIGRRDRLGAVAVRHVPGNSLDVGWEAEPAALEDAGVCLARLHTTRTELPPGRQPVAAPDTADAIAGLLPGEARRARGLARSVTERLGRMAAPAASVPVHGDCSLDQVVRGRDGTTLIDLDHAHQGTAADDLGGLLTDLRVRLDGRADQAFEALLRGYAAVVPPPDRTLIASWAAHHALARAADPFRFCEPDWAALVAGRLELAAALLQESS